MRIYKFPYDCSSILEDATFRQSLQTNSLSVAKVRVLPIIHQWKLDLAAAANIAPNSLQSKVNAVRLDKNERAIQEDIALELAVSYDENGNKIYDDTLFTAISIAHGDVILLAEHIEVYLRQANLEQKTIDEKRKHLKEFSERFKTSEDLTKVELQRWVDELLEEKIGQRYTRLSQLVGSFGSGLNAEMRLIWAIHSEMFFLSQGGKRR